MATDTWTNLEIDFPPGGNFDDVLDLNENTTGVEREDGSITAVIVVPDDADTTQFTNAIVAQAVTSGLPNPTRIQLVGASEED